MDIKTDKDIDGRAVRHLREKAGLSQKSFWNPLGLTQSGGCRYENGAPIPKPVRTLVFMAHVAGLSIDASSPEGAQSLIRLAHLQASERADDKAKMGEKISSALSHVKSAKRALDQV